MGFPNGTVVRLTAAGSDDPVTLAQDPSGSYLALPEESSWDDVRGGFIEIRSPGRRPLFFSAFDRPLIDAASAAQAFGVDRPYVLKKPRPCVLVINDVGPVGGNGLESENRVRQVQADVVRHLVSRVSRDKRCELKTLARVAPGLGNWPEGYLKSDLLDYGGQNPFAPSRHDLPPENLARSLQDSVLMRVGAGDLSDRIQVIVTTPYSPTADDSSPARWLRAMAKRTGGAVQTQTVVVGAPAYVTDAELSRRYVNPVRAATGPSVEIGDEARRAAEAALTSSSLGFEVSQQ
jgi:hypothetical protein